MTPTQDDYNDWARSPVTRWVFEQIANTRQKVQHQVVQGTGIYHPGDANKTTALMGQMIGFVQGLDELQKIKPRGSK